MIKSSKLRKSGLFLLATFIYFTSIAQENYIPGQIIKLNKDTINGFVDYRNWEINPDLIKFKKSLSDAPVSFSPLDILEFRVNDEIYVGAIIQTEVSSKKISELQNDPTPNTQLDTTFLQSLFRGKKELYFYRNQERRQNFYIKQNGDFELLLYKKYQKLQNEKKLVIENKRYLGQLSLYLDECEEIQDRIKSASYEVSSLFKLFKFYTQCSQVDISFQKEEMKITPEFGILGGISQSSINFESRDFPFLVNVDYGSSINPTFGLFLDLIFPRSHGKWSITNEIAYTTYNLEGIYEEFLNENTYAKTTTKMGNSYIKLNNLVRFKYPIGSAFIFFNAGMSNGISINSTNYTKKESRFFFDEKFSEGPMLERTTKYENGLLFGTGLKFKNYSFELRAESGSGMSVYSGLSSTVTRFYFQFGYKF